MRRELGLLQQWLTMQCRQDTGSPYLMQRSSSSATNQLSRQNQNVTKQFAAPNVNSTACAYCSPYFKGEL